MHDVEPLSSVSEISCVKQNSSVCEYLQHYTVTSEIALAILGTASLSICYAGNVGAIWVRSYPSLWPWEIQVKSGSIEQLNLSNGCGKFYIEDLSEQFCLRNREHFLISERARNYFANSYSSYTSHPSPFQHRPHLKIPTFTSFLKPNPILRTLYVHFHSLYILPGHMHYNACSSRSEEVGSASAISILISWYRPDCSFMHDGLSNRLSCINTSINIPPTHHQIDWKTFFHGS